MSNNKQIMKLYTEEQLLEAYDLGHGLTKDEVLEEFTPIEILIDEEINKRKTLDFCYKILNEHINNGYVDVLEFYKKEFRGNK